MTPERLTHVDFFAPPDMRAVSELVLTGKAIGPLASVEDLGGKTVYARRSSSYFTSLQSLNARFASEGKPAAKIVPMDEALEDEDLMEMLDAGVIGAIVVDDWAFRKNSPLLLAEISGYCGSRISSAPATR